MRGPLAVVELQTRIDKATSEVARSYAKALREAVELKKKINDLEMSISEKNPPKTAEDMDHLSCAVDMLNGLTDSLISGSKKAWDEYKMIEHDCKMGALELDGLSGLRYLCKKTEEFASDLLCYSMGLFKRKEIQSGLL